MATETSQKLALPSLTAMVIGSMVGAGIFSLPATFGRATGPFGALIAWAVAGTGMLMLAFVFQMLAQRKPEIDNGVFAYAKFGFGDFLGFCAAFGFWAGTCLGNVTYFVLINSTLGLFFPAFGEGNTPFAVLFSSAILWTVHALVLRGIKEAAFINTVVTVAKIVPIIVFIGALVFVFDLGKFVDNFWGGGAYSFAEVFDQVRGTMLVTVFVFIGIEGAAVYSRFAQRREHVGIATVTGFVSVLCLMVLVTLLPYGLLDRAQIGAIQQPSMAGMLEAAVGPWGRTFVSIGLLVSVLGAYLAWTLLAAEMMYSAALGEVMPRLFTRVNANQVPSAALWVTSILVQLFLLVSVLAREAFDLSLALTSAKTLIPYILVAAFALKLTWQAELYDAGSAEHRREAVVAVIATIYTSFMLVAGGLNYVLLSAIIFAPGSILFIVTRLERGQKVFEPFEWIVFLAVLAGAVVGIYGLFTGVITI
jgi:arginine:ornithine antiporter/lysine permease